MPTDRNQNSLQIKLISHLGQEIRKMGLAHFVSLKNLSKLNETPQRVPENSQRGSRWPEMQPCSNASIKAMTVIGYNTKHLLRNCLSAKEKTLKELNSEFNLPFFKIMQQ